MKKKTNLPADLFWRVFLICIAVAMLVAVYIFQRLSVPAFFVRDTQSLHPYLVFGINRYIRLLMNDLACFALIFAIFREAKYLKLAFWVFLGECFIILPLYLVVKLSLEGDSEISSPLLSQIHRLIVN